MLARREDTVKLCIQQLADLIVSVNHPVRDEVAKYLCCFGQVIKSDQFQRGCFG